MRVLRVSLIAIMIVLALSFAGCGRRTKVEVTTPPPSSSEGTLGRQLIDLQEAYEKGAITEKQYNDAKKKLLKQKK